jgi:hypothetical protein
MFHTNYWKKFQKKEGVSYAWISTGEGEPKQENIYTLNEREKNINALKKLTKNYEETLFYKKIADLLRKNDTITEQLKQ